MPNPSLSEALKEAYSSAPANQVLYDTLEFSQPGVQASVYIVNGFRALAAYDEDNVLQNFLPVAFQFSLPPQTSEGVQNLNLAVDNVGKAALQFVKTALTQKVPVEAIYRPYLSTDLSAPQMNPPLTLYLKNISITSTQITAQASFLDLVNKRFPLNYYTALRFPTLAI